MRPSSRSAALGLLTDIVRRLGPDNMVSPTAATIYGSTETTFYVAAVYFGAMGSHGRDCFRNNLPGGAILVWTDHRTIRPRVDPANGAPGGRALPNRQSIIVQIFPSPADNLIFYREIFRK